MADGERKKTRAFSELLSHYLFAVKFGRPAKGNDKGKVENLVGYTRRNFMVPIPRAASWEALNEQFIRDAMARRAQRLRGHRETIGERFERDRAALLPLPAARFEACDKVTARVSSISLVRYRTNDYSVPTQYGHRQVLVKAYVHRIVIVAGSEVIAEHKRSYEREAAVYDPLHYLALLEHKSRASGPSRAAGGMAVARVLCSTAPVAGGTAAQARRPGVYPGAAADRAFRVRGCHGRRRAGARAERDQLRRRPAPGALSHRTQAAAAGHGQLAAPAAGRSAHYACC